MGKMERYESVMLQKKAFIDREVLLEYWRGFSYVSLYKNGLFLFEFTGTLGFIQISKLC